MLTAQEIFTHCKNYTINLGNKWKSVLDRPYNFRDSNGNQCALMNLIQTNGIYASFMIGDGLGFEYAYKRTTGRQVGDLESDIMEAFDMPKSIHEPNNFMENRFRQIAENYVLQYDEPSDIRNESEKEQDNKILLTNRINDLEE